jgi:hypothetical protein
MASEERWIEAVAAVAEAGSPTEQMIAAVFDTLESAGQGKAASQLLAELSERVSPSRLGSAYNCTTRCLARGQLDEAGLRPALDLLNVMIAKEELDVHYATFNVVAQACEAAGLPDKAEQVMQVRYAMYHSSD